MRTLDRYLSIQVIKACLLVLVALVGISALLDFIHQLSKIDNVSGLSTAIYFTLLELPGNVYELMPISVLAGSLMSFSTLITQAELVAAGALGYSRKGTILLTLKVAGIFIVAMVICGNFLIPIAEKSIRHLKEGEGFDFQPVNSNLWIRDGRNFIHVEYALGERYYNVSLFEYDTKHERLSAITQANSMMVDETQFVLSNPEVAQINSKQINLLPLESKIIQRKVKTEGVVLQVITPEILNAWDLYRHTAFLKENQLYSDFHELELWKRFSDPLSILVMLLLALPLIFTEKRDASVGLNLLLGLVIGLSYVILDRLINGMLLFFEVNAFWGAFTLLFLSALIGSIRLREHSALNLFR